MYKYLMMIIEMENVYILKNWCWNGMSIFKNCFLYFLLFKIKRKFEKWLNLYRVLVLLNYVDIIVGYWNKIK